MKTKNLVLMALLVAVGAALYVVIPGFNGMTPDFMLTMMFIGIFLFPDKRSVFLLALTTGVVSGLFSKVPSGFIPNVVDKLITAYVFFGLVLLLKQYAKKLPVGAVLVAVGTLISGTIFLSVALFVMGIDLQGGFATLFGVVVLPAIALNAIAYIIIYPIITQLVKRSKFETALSNS